MSAPVDLHAVHLTVSLCLRAVADIALNVRTNGCGSTLNAKDYVRTVRKGSRAKRSKTIS